MKVIAEKMLQMRRRLKSAGVAVWQKAAAGLSRLRRVPEMPAKPEPWWRVRLPKLNNKTAAASEAATTVTPRPRRSPLMRAVRIAAMVLLAYLILPYILVPVYAIIDPPFSAYMARQVLTGTDIRHEWVDFDDISPHLVTAVLLAEDASFCRHRGVDWNAVGEALEAAEDGETPRGASTIPMQTAKNLFLWNNQDYLRKALEMPIAYYMSVVLSKRRVAEIYLNVAEWGPGIFGVEAAARYHFGKSAASLSTTEASLLAASLPSPLKRRAGRPSAKLSRIANHIDERTEREAKDVECVFE